MSTEQLQTRKHPLAVCELCPLSARPCVPSYVPEKPTAAVIGEGPGYDEAKQGVPFVGASGQLLERVFKHIGLDYQGVARFNAVLCHPEKNETPDLQALTCCAPRLKAELNDLPDIPLITLGNISTQVLDNFADALDLQEQGITKRRGTFYPLNDDLYSREYLATVHPAYVLRNPNQVRLFIDDITKAVKEYKKQQLDWLGIKYIVATVDNWPRVKEYLDNIPDGTPVAYDTETGGLQWWDTFEVSRVPFLCLVLTDSTERAIIIPAETFLKADSLAYYEPIIDYLEGFFKRVKPIAHNAKFDTQVGLSYLDLYIEPHFDTMLASFALNEIKGYNGLKYLAEAVLGALDYERIVLGSDFVDLSAAKKNYADLPPAKLYKYAAIDACATLALYRVLNPRLDEDQVRPSFDVLMKGHYVTQWAGYRGIKIDRRYLEGLGDVLEEQKIDLTMRLWYLLNKYPFISVTPPYYTKVTDLTEPFTKPTKSSKPFNPGSDDQAAYIIYELLGLKHIKPLSHKTKPTSTNEEALLALPPHPFVKGLIQYRTVAKLLSTYVNKLLTIADTNDRVHINFNLNGTETGRLSADDSLHGIPRPADHYGKALRGSFIAEKGHKLVIGDYSQAELRVIAALSGESFFLDAFNMSTADRHLIAADRYPQYATATEDQRDALAKLATDVHSKTAMYLFDEYEGLELAVILQGLEKYAGQAKELRTFAKNFNFGTVFLGGVEGLWSMTGGKLPKERIKALQTIHHSATPTLQKFCREQFRRVKKDGYVQTRMGRKRRFPLLVYDNIDEVRKASVNMPVQSAASDLNLLSAYKLEKRHWSVVHLIHDSIILEVPEDRTTQAVAEMREVMIATGDHYFPEVKWAVDIEVASRWYDRRPDLSQGLPPLMFD